NGKGDGHLIQRWASRLGLGHRTGIDLPAESPGLIPSPEWRDRLFRKHLTDRPWSVGDNVNLAVGQGDLEATPMQMATAYSAVANGGRVLRPHIGLEVDDAAGRVLQTIQPGANRKIQLDPGNRQAILDGLHLAASAPGGTSADVWAGFPQDRLPVFGKTGTAQTFDHGIEFDQSWYVCWIKDVSRPNDPGIVVAVTVEKGGFGAEAAAPAARLIASHWFGVRGKIVSGKSRTN